MLNPRERYIQQWNAQFATTNNKTFHRFFLQELIRPSGKLVRGIKEIIESGGKYRIDAMLIGG